MNVEQGKYFSNDINNFLKQGLCDETMKLHQISNDLIVHSISINSSTKTFDHLQF